MSEFDGMASDAEIVDETSVSCACGTPMKFVITPYPDDHEGLVDLDVFHGYTHIAGRVVEPYESVVRIAAKLLDDMNSRTMNMWELMELDSSCSRVWSQAAKVAKKLMERA